MPILLLGFVVGKLVTTAVRSLFNSDGVGSNQDYPPKTASHKSVLEEGPGPSPEAQTTDSQVTNQSDLTAVCSPSETDRGQERIVSKPPANRLFSRRQTVTAVVVAGAAVGIVVCPRARAAVCSLGQPALSALSRSRAAIAAILSTTPPPQIPAARSVAGSRNLAACSTEGKVKFDLPRAWSKIRAAISMVPSRTARILSATRANVAVTSHEAQTKPAPFLSVARAKIAHISSEARENVLRTPEAPTRTAPFHSVARAKIAQFLDLVTDTVDSVLSYILLKLLDFFYPVLKCIVVFLWRLRHHELIELFIRREGRQILCFLIF